MSVSPSPSPGVRVGVAFDASGERGSFAEGPADPSTGRRVTADDPVRVASISKLAVAIGVMRLVEDGRLDLDRPVGEALGFPVENPAFPGQPVTLRKLLSHTSSLRDGVNYWAVPLGEGFRHRLADPAAWDLVHGPDSGFFTYSNLNFPLVAGVMEKVTGERFDRLMQRLLFDPMKLDACFNWMGCSDSAVARAIVLTQGGEAVRDALGGKRPLCAVAPSRDGGCDLSRWRAGENGVLFSPQGGLRISGRGLARIGRMLLGNGTIDGVRILSPASVETLLRPQWRFDGANGVTEGGIYCRYGLSAHRLATPVSGCADDPGLPKGQWVGHSGDAYGLRSGLWIDRERGVGIAYFATGLDEVPPRGRSGLTAAEEAMAGRAVALLQQRP